MKTYEEMCKAVEGKSLEWLEGQRFMNAMNDHWSKSDYTWDTVLWEAIQKIKEALKYGNA